MNDPKAYLLLACLMSVTGCVSPKKITVLPSIGPAPQQPQPAAQGLLCVYSAHETRLIDLPMEEWVWNNDFGKNEFLNEPFTDYLIYAEDGKLLKRVHNACGPSGFDPVHVSLLPGHYELQAQAENGAGQMPVRVPVIVKAGENTSVHLEVGWKPRHPYHNNDVAHLPDGQIAGWLAAP